MNLVAMLVGWGVPAKLAKPLLYAVGALLLLLAVFAAVKLHDRRVIAQHQAQQDASNAKADRKADQQVAEQRRADDARQTNETQEINNAVSEAKRTGADPRAAYYHCVQLQQAARAAKRVVPACA
jgi:heme exporter protein D